MKNFKLHFQYNVFHNMYDLNYKSLTFLNFVWLCFVFYSLLKRNNLKVLEMIVFRLRNDFRICPVFVFLLFNIETYHKRFAIASLCVSEHASYVLCLFSSKIYNSGVCPCTAQVLIMIFSLLEACNSFFYLLVQI